MASRVFKIQKVLCVLLTGHHWTEGVVLTRGRLPSAVASHIGNLPLGTVDEP
jgi:hypothetical protein